MKTKFKSKIDPFLAILLLVGPLGSVIAVIITIIQSKPIPWAISVLLAIVFVFPLTFLFNTNYTINGKDLLIQCGLIRWRIKLFDIKSIEPLTKFDMTSSAALSFDRLSLIYGDNKSVLISPKEKERFIKEINKRKA